MDWHLFFAVFWVNYWLVFAGLGIVILFFSWLSGVLAKKTSRPEVDLSEPRDIFYLGMGITSIFNMFFAVFMSGWDAFLVVALWLLLGYVLVVAEAKRFVSWREAGKRKPRSGPAPSPRVLRASSPSPRSSPTNSSRACRPTSKAPRCTGSAFAPCASVFPAS